MSEMDFTDRAILALANEVVELEERAARVKAIVASLASERGIQMPAVELDGLSKGV
jgi:hypothetical protein